MRRRAIDVRVRLERDDDREEVRALVAEAFAKEGRGEPVEAALLDRLRASPEWMPRLSLVATHADRIAGHVVCSRAYVEASPVLALGPLAVVPELQRSGVGTALMEAVLTAAQELGETVVVLLGDPRYYARFGFRRAGELGIVSPVADWSDDLQVHALEPSRSVPRGVFRFAPAFDGL